MGWRIINLALDDPNIARQLNKNNKELSNVLIILTFLEKISDAAKRIARALEKLTLKKEDVDKLEKLYSEVLERYRGLIRAYFNGEGELAAEICNQHKKAIEDCNKLLYKSSPFYVKDSKCFVNFVIVCEQLKAMESHIHYICRIVAGLGIEKGSVITAK